MIYLDYAAATPVSDEVFAAMQPYYSEKFFNPSATYLTARGVKKDLEAARAVVAGALGARPVEVTFTAGGTEANNLAIQGVMQAFPGSNVIVSAVEHESVLAPAEKFNHKLAPVDSKGTVDIDALAGLIDDQTVLVSVMYANNEVGTIQPIAKISQCVAKIKDDRRRAGNERPLYLHTDACQASLYLDLHVSRLGVDMMTLNGGKMYGPKQSGVLFADSAVRLNPQILGGGQEKGMRSGTENIAFAVGLSVALQSAQNKRHEESKRLQTLQQQFIKLLEESTPATIVNGSTKTRLPNNVHVTFPGVDNERLLMQLDEEGIMAAAGSACSASNEEPSHVLRAMGLSDADAQSSIRFTMGRSSTDEDVRKVVAELARLSALQA